MTSDKINWLIRTVDEYVEGYLFDSDMYTKNFFDEEKLEKVESLIATAYKQDDENALDLIFEQLQRVEVSDGIGERVLSVLNKSIEESGQRHFVTHALDYVADALYYSKPQNKAIFLWGIKSFQIDPSPVSIGLLAAIYSAAENSEIKIRVYRLLIHTLFLEDNNLDGWAAHFISQEDVPLERADIKKLYKKFEADYWQDICADISVWFSKKKDPTVLQYVLSALKSGEAGTAWIEAAVNYNNPEGNALLKQLLEKDDKAANTYRSEINELR